jgi:PAS domain S-box-containing protein
VDSQAIDGNARAVAVIMAQEPIRAVIPRAAGPIALGVSALAAVTAVSLWLGFDSGPTAFLYLIVITLLSLVSGFLPAFLLSILAVTALNFFFVPPTFSLSVPSVLDNLELAGFLTVATVTTHLVSRATRVGREADSRARLLDLTHDAVIRFGLDRRITYWNRGAEKLYGWTAGEAIGRRSTLLQPTYPGPYDEDIASALAQTGFWQGEAIHTTRDGRRVLTDSRLVLERDEAGAPVGVLATMNDVTDRRTAEENLRNAQEALTHATRLTTLGEVSASIAHEINQPLTAIVNNANASLVLLSDAQPNLEEVRAALEDVVNDADRASAIMARVRQMSRRTAPQQAPCRIHDIVADVAALSARLSALRAIAIVTEIPHDLPPVLGDRVQLEQVLLNLVVNAMDAMSDVEPSQRRVEIRAAVDTDDGQPSVTLRVADRGVGLKREDMSRLFEAFYTTKPQGIGLGLAISRSIVEAHRGRLWAEANDERGAVFAFRLPAAQPGAET